MPTINDPYDLVENLFGFTPEKETLSLAEKNSIRNNVYRTSKSQR